MSFAGRTGAMDDLDDRLPAVVGTLRALLVEGGALRVVALLDRGAAGEPLVIDCAADGALELDDGERTRTLELAAIASPGFPLPALRPLRGLEVDPVAGTVAAPIGALDAIAAALRTAARALGGRSVVTAAFATADPEGPMYLAARGEEPLVVSVGELEFELESSR